MATPTYNSPQQWVEQSGNHVVSFVDIRSKVDAGGFVPVDYVDDPSRWENIKKNLNPLRWYSWYFAYMAGTDPDFTYEYIVDTSAGAVDGVANAINPFDEFWSIPDIGMVYGHEDAYANGQIAGTVAAIGVNIALSMIPGAGLVHCGTWGAKAFVVWEMVNAAGDVATAAKHAYEGNFGWSDALGLAGAGLSMKGLGNINCFTVDMHLAEGMLDRQLVIPPAPLARTDRDADVNDAWMVLSVGMLFTTSLQFRRGRQRRFSEMSHEPLIPDTFTPRADRSDSSNDDTALDAVYSTGEWLEDKRAANESERKECPDRLVPRAAREEFTSRAAADELFAQPPRRNAHPSELRRWLFLFVGLLCSGFCLLQSGRVSLPSATATITGSPDSFVSGSQSDKRSAYSATASDSPQYKMKSVADFKVGDDILAYNTSTKKLEVRKVKNAFRKTADHLRLLTLHDEAGAEQTIKTTNEHPFFRVWRNNSNAGEWIESERLTEGDKLRTPTGELATLISTEYEPHPEGIAVYNVEVDDLHSYFVSAQGARGPPVLSHNKTCADDLLSVSEKSDGRKAWVKFEKGAANAEKNTAYGLKYENLNPRGRNYVKFDGYEATKSGKVTSMIDRKTNIFFTDKAIQQAQRQSRALSQNDLKGIWEVPNQAAKKLAEKLLNDNGIERISVRVVP